uniref:Aldehyde dehydrogenase 3 family, member B2 n=1 Tax=Sphaeramia orbicularis TaxID=375764 RepID=A0A673CVL7_9TELE
MKTYPLECVDLLRRARVAFKAGRTIKESFRLAQLDALVRMLEEHECDFVDALGRDLHKPRFETVVSELILVKNEALYAINNLKKWMQPQHVERNLSTSLDECLVISEPLGVVFIMGTWCSPVQMCLVPLVGAIAAGNCAIISPSEYTTHTLKARFVQALKCCLMQFYGSDPRESRSFGRMVNLEIFNKTKDILWRSGKVAVGGQVIEGEKYIAPTILTEVAESDSIMQQDVFGPVLPVLTVDNVDEAIAFINRHEKPLCVYAYSSNSKVISRLMCETSSGSFCSNDSILQSLMVALPFGGVGKASGIGSYHGRYSFDTFSHKKSCLLRSTHLECVTYLRYPPYEERNLSLMTWASTLSQRSQGWCQIL